MPPERRYKKFAFILILGLLLLLPAGGYAAGREAAPAPPVPAVQLAPTLKPVGEKVAVDGQGRAIYQVRANGIKMGYKLAGAGEPLVLIPGLGGTMEGWPSELLEALSRKYQLILLDNRGMGYSTANGRPFTYGLFAKDVISLLDALGVKKTNVLGFSMGSAITQKLLLDYPQRFQKAVIYATTTDGSKVAALLKGKKIENPIIRRQLEATAQWRTPLHKLPLITQQVLLVVGTADEVVGPEGSKTLAARIPGAWLAQFKNGGHALMREAPREFTRIVLTFLEINETVTRAR
ncbi:MAG: alpha/beta hydrolase [Syntrophales bacterium]|nr:alpha/beta hydrolase [Syntrophales bacterium]MDD5642569.1 alpha/beta hydrolase [Syntrophales bacterium]